MVGLLLDLRSHTWRAFIWLALIWTFDPCMHCGPSSGPYTSHTWLALIWTLNSCMHGGPVFGPWIPCMSGLDLGLRSPPWLTFMNLRSRAQLAFIWTLDMTEVQMKAHNAKIWPLLFYKGKKVALHIWKVWSDVLHWQKYNTLNNHSKKEC